MARHIVLVGLMGSGKTVVGERLAARLGRPFVDNDRLLAASTGLEAVELARARGADELHALERAVLESALAGEPDAVVGAAASIADDATVADLLAPHTVVWLQTDPETLVGRLSRPGHRPFLDGDPLATLRDQAEERQPRFAALADATVDTATRTPDEVVDRILARLP